MKLYRVFSLFVIFTMMLSYASLPANAAVASSSTKAGGQQVTQPGFLLQQANETFCELLAKGSGSLEEMAYFVANCPQRQLKVQKIADAAAVNAGDPMGFTIILTNIGGIALTNVILRDQLDMSIGWTVSHTQCTLDEELGQLFCQFGTLQVGSSVSVHISAISTPAMCDGPVTNIVEGAADQVVASGAMATIDVNCKPNVVLKKTEENPSIVAGDTARYTLEVKNIGTGAAEGVELTDNLPDGAGLDWSVDSVNGGGNCEISGSVLSCDFGTLNPDEVRKVVVSTSTTPASCGDITNDASVSATNEATTEQNDNDDSATITVYCTTLKVEKLEDDERIKANDQIGFVIKVTNSGTSVAKNVTLTDPLPAGVSWSEDSSNCSINSGTNTISCSFGDLDGGKSASVHVTGLSSSAVCGTMTNTATAKADNIATESKDTATVIIECEPNLSVVKTPEKAVVPAGSPVRFTLTAKNSGSAAATDVVLTDTLPSNSELTWSFDNVTAGGSCAINAGVLTCTFSSLPAGQSASVRVSAVSTMDTCGYLANTVTARASNTSIVTDIAQIHVLCAANIKVTKVAADAEIMAGKSDEPAKFIITVTSDGVNSATNVTLTDALPSINGLAWKIDSVTAGSCAITSGTLKCNFGNLAPGQVRVITISSPTSRGQFCQPDSNRLIENYVTVAASNESEDDLYDNNSYAKILVGCTDVIVCEAPDELYTNNFDTNTPGPAFWSTYPITTSPNGTQKFLGELSNDDLRFTYPDTNPVGHQMIIVEFDLYVIRSWDGNIKISYGKNVGPDLWQFKLLNETDQVVKTFVNSTFTNYIEPQFKTFRQSFPAPYPLGDNSAATGAAYMNKLGYQFAGPRDSIYHFVYILPHTDTNVKLSLKALGLQVPADESWGIDNFSLTLMRCNTEFAIENTHFFPFMSNANSAGSSILTQDVRTEDQ